MKSYTKPNITIFKIVEDEVLNASKSFQTYFDFEERIKFSQEW